MQRTTIEVRVQQVCALILLILILGAQLAVCEEKHDKQAEGMALVKRAIELTDLSQSGPYRLHSTVVLLDEVLLKAVVGEESIVFASPQRWRKDLHIRDYYDESAFFIDSKMYRERSLGFTPPAARMSLTTKLRSLPALLGFKVVRVYPRQVFGVSATCAVLYDQADGKREPTWCFDTKSGLPVEFFFKGSSHRYEFRDYKPFKQHFVPATVEMFAAGKLYDHASIEMIEGVPEDPKTFEPPASSEARAWCDNPTRARVVSYVAPHIPSDLPWLKGWSYWYEVTVDERGKMTNLVPMAPNPYVDKGVTDGAKSWRFKAAMCGTIPVPSDITLNVLEDFQF